MAHSENGIEVNLEAGSTFEREEEGYDRLAALMGQVPETAIYRRFSTLAAQDLLYRQAELIQLEKDLKQCQKKDKKSGNTDRASYHINYDTLQRSGEEDAEEGNDGTQWETILDIREKLKEYQEAVFRARKMLALTSPPPRQLNALTHWMKRQDMGNICLISLDRNAWASDDLFALGLPQSEDPYINQVSLTLIHWYNRLIGQYIHRTKSQKSDVLHNTIRYSESGVYKILKSVATIIACLVPVAAIVALNFISTMNGRLAAVGAFTATFSGCLRIFSSASMKDIFSATATFAAILVVFIGTTLSSITEPSKTQ